MFLAPGRVYQRVGWGSTQTPSNVTDNSWFFFHNSLETQLHTRNKRQRVEISHRGKTWRIRGWLGCKRKTEDRRASVQALKCYQEEEGIALTECGPGGCSQETCEKLREGRFLFVLLKTFQWWELRLLCSIGGDWNVSRNSWWMSSFQLYDSGAHKSCNNEVRMCYFRSVHGGIISESES